MHVWYVDKKWSIIRGIARHKVCMVLPNISLLFEQNLPPFRAEPAGRPCSPDGVFSCHWASLPSADSFSQWMVWPP